MFSSHYFVPAEWTGARPPKASLRSTAVPRSCATPTPPWGVAAGTGIPWTLFSLTLVLRSFFIAGGSTFTASIVASAATIAIIAAALASPSDFCMEISSLNSPEAT
jgi:hypothetical protein